MTYFQKYNKIEHNGKHFKTAFELNNTPLFIANSFRRSFSSLIPTVTFDDTYYEDPEIRPIVIKKNTSALHNEFLSHRLSHIPLSLEIPNVLDITSKLNKNGERKFEFLSDTYVPIFTLKIKNDLAQKANRDKDGLISVTTQHFTVVDESSKISIDSFMPLDVFTDSPIIINKLKYNITDENEGDELELFCKPTIGQGRHKARNNPTGTVTFQFKIDEDDKIENVFQDKLQYLNKERESKGLDHYNSIEEKQLRTSFDLLDRERVYHKDESGNPDIFEISVESIGFLNPNQIIYDGVSMLYISLKDIMNSITIKSVENKGEKIYTYNLNRKISVKNLDSNENIGTSIHVEFENHTIGNMLNQMIRNTFCGSMASDMDILSIASYRMNHPTIENIEFIMVPHTHLTKKDFIRYIKQLSGEEKFEYLDLDTKQPLDYFRKLFCVNVFLNSINRLLYTIGNILYEFRDISKIEKTSFIVNEDSDYYKHNTWCNGTLSGEKINVDMLTRTV